MEFNRPSRKLINFVLSLKKLVEKILFFFLKKIINVKKNKYSQSVIIPNATYSPWKDNREFQDIFKQIKKFTTLDVMRLYELWYLDDQIKNLDGDYIEIGVYKGGSSALIAKKKIQTKHFFYVILSMA